MNKKTILLLTCALPLVLSACYSTLDEERARTQKRRAYQSVMGCQTDDIYQNAGYRECVEATAAEKAKKHKTVYLSENMEGTAVVVPKGEGDLEMLDPTAVYERVEVKTTTTEGEEESAEVVITEESLVYVDGAETAAPAAPAAEEQNAQEAAPVEAPASEVPATPVIEETFEEKFFKDYKGVEPMQKFEETSEKVPLEEEPEEKIRKNEKELLPTEQK